VCLTAQRLGVDLSDGAMVARCCGNAFMLISEALADVAMLQFPPSMVAAAVLLIARKAQVGRPEAPPNPRQNLF
jgi:Cyclin, C-terminal domain